MEIKFMKAAIREAKKAMEKDEVPIGAVLVLDGKIIARAHNLMEKTQLATAHAELLCINKASKKLKSWRYCCNKKSRRCNSRGSKTNNRKKNW